jgi:hypothetical protein
MISYLHPLSLFLQQFSFLIRESMKISGRIKEKIKIDDFSIFFAFPFYGWDINLVD